MISSDLEFYIGLGAIKLNVICLLWMLIVNIWKSVLKGGDFTMGNKVIHELANHAVWIGVSMVIGYLLHVTYPVHNNFSELLVPILVCGIVAGTVCDIDERETNE